MDIFGIDFTSTPTRSKPLTCVRCRFRGDVLQLEEETSWTSFAPFDAFLQSEGRWIAGLDFPFGQSRRFVENMGWPRTWADYTRFAASLGRPGYRAALDTYRAPRPAGDKEHRRAVDVATGAISPQKLYGVPVGLMYFEGAPRLLDSPATIPHLKDGDPDRVIVEAYPGIVVRNLLGRKSVSYKSDTRAKQTVAHMATRRQIVELLKVPSNPYGFVASGINALADDPTGDRLDAFLCAVQAAWAWMHRDSGYGAPADVDPLEGWIADPAVVS
ncbi:DUF429 domain-containing protein [Sinirhodobacter populi]|uniref:DUF429 domain-containing protein n=1 Tax=Paenirhodobacter populi TaxID=2306993 RepID=A0A443KII7_9RHOB|nr:DUF429 domain-containing protein [Sinirhodobacter populi]RWR32592.1 DUF429 domain-containing protein [Sinirhodobacter populi]